MSKLKQLKTFEDACKIEGIDPASVKPDFSFMPEKDRRALEAHLKLVIVARAANRIENDGKEWEPDWDNGEWDKYYPWFFLDGGSSGFRFFDYVHWISISFVGSRLCFKSAAAAEYVARQFIDLYRDYMTIAKEE